MFLEMGLQESSAPLREKVWCNFLVDWSFVRAAKLDEMDLGVAWMGLWRAFFLFCAVITLSNNYI